MSAQGLVPGETDTVRSPFPGTRNPGIPAAPPGCAPNAQPETGESSLTEPEEGRVLPLWSTRELASVVVENLGPDAGAYLHRGLAHGAAMALLLTTASWAVGALRLRTVSLPAPDLPTRRRARG